MSGSRRLLLVSWGRGNGHITRLLAISRAFHAQGWECVLLGHDEPVHDELTRHSGVSRVVRYPKWAEEADPWTLWGDQTFVERSVAFDSSVVADVKPDRVINDNRLSMLISCAASGTPVVTLCQDNQVPGHCFGDGPVSDIWTSPIPGVNSVLSVRGLPTIRDDLRELFRFGRIAIPSSPDLDPIRVEDAGVDLVYTGPLGAVVAGADGQDLLFYRTVGRVDEEFVDAFGDWRGRVYVATGDARAAAELDHVPSWISVATLWDLAELAPTLGAVVHHGGHGITTTCLSSGIPAVVLPGHNPERRSNAERGRGLGLAEVLEPTSAEGTLWGPCVDVTGDRPGWSVVRAAADRTLRSVRPIRRSAARITTDLVEVLT